VASETGTVKWKALPLPGSLSTQIRPLCASTIPLAMESPRPTPRASAESACQKRLKGLA